MRLRVDDYLALDDETFRAAVLAELDAISLRASGIAVAKTVTPTPAPAAAGGAAEVRMDLSLLHFVQSIICNQVPKEWSKDELKLLTKASQALPVGTRDRYERIAEYLHQHGRTTYTRSAKVVLRSVQGGSDACRT